MYTTSICGYFILGLNSLCIVYGYGDCVNEFKTRKSKIQIKDKIEPQLYHTIHYIFSLSTS